MAGCILHCEPIRFAYGGKHWKIELWKGQYGSFYGAEVGIYTGSFELGIPILDHTIRKLGDGDTDCAKPEDWLRMSFKLKHQNGKVLFTRNSDNLLTLKIEKHWWLTGFKLGIMRPSDLIAEITLHFKTSEMMGCFIQELKSLGYQTRDYNIINNNSVMVVFNTPYTQPQPGQWALNSYEAMYSDIHTYVSKIFLGVSYTLSDIGNFLISNYNISGVGVAIILKNLSFSAKQIAQFLKRNLTSYLSEIGNALKSSGFNKEEIGKALKYCGFGLSEIADFIKRTYNLTNKDVAKLLREIAYGIDDIVQYFKEKGIGYKDIIDFLKFAGYTKRTIQNAIERAFSHLSDSILSALNSIF